MSQVIVISALYKFKNSKNRHLYIVDCLNIVKMGTVNSVSLESHKADKRLQT